MEKINKKTPVVLLITCLLFVFGAPAWAALDGSAIPNPEDLIPELNPQAPGQKYSGPLTLYYAVTAVSGNAICTDLGFPASELVDMHMFTRLRKGTSVSAFGGVATGLCYDDTDGGQAAAVKAFLDAAVQDIAPGGVGALKAVDDIVQDDTNSTMTPGDGTPEDPFFLILDWTIAIVE